MDRSNRPDVRNPVLALPEAQAILAMPECPHCGSRSKLRALFLAIRRQAHATADKAWETRKAPMASYWRVVGVLSGHIGRLFK